MTTPPLPPEIKSAEEVITELETYNQVNEPPMLCLSPIALKTTIRQRDIAIWNAAIEAAAHRVMCVNKYCHLPMSNEICQDRHDAILNLKRKE